MKKILLVLSIFYSFSATAQLTAEEIIKKSDEIMKGIKSTQSELVITTVRPKWTRTMEVKSWSKGKDLSLIYVESPVKDKGTTFLMKDKEVWNWIPSIERTIKMPPSMMMQNWMGTDFTNDDLVQESSIVTDYDHKIIGDSTINGKPCYKIQLIPHEDAAVAWGKIVSFVDKEHFFQLRSEFYDEDFELVNVMNSYDIKEMGGRLLPAKMEMIPVDKKGQKTVMEYKSIEFDVPIEDSFFTVQNMKRIR